MWCLWRGDFSFRHILIKCESFRPFEFAQDKLKEKSHNLFLAKKQSVLTDYSNAISPIVDMTKTVFAN